MDEKVLKLLNVTSIPAVLIIFYMELQSIENQVQQTEELTRAVTELRESLQMHCHSIIARGLILEEEQTRTKR